MKFADKNTALVKRRVIVVSNDEKFITLMSNIDWEQLGIDVGKEFLNFLLRGNIATLMFKILFKREMPQIGRDILNGKYAGKLGIPIFNEDDIKDFFKFPPQHPILNSAYAVADITPNQYVPLATFHEYMKQAKHAAFIELAACLGAKEIHLEHAEINNEVLDVNVDAAVPTKLGKLNLGIQDRRTFSSTSNSLIAFSFPHKNSTLKEFNSPWVDAEPAWDNMAKMRRNHFLEHYSAEFNYCDEMGITTSLSAKLVGLGISIGGNFTEMQSIKIKYKVIFWPMD